MILIDAIYINIGFFSSLFILSTLLCYILKSKCWRIIVIIKKKKENIEHLSSFMQNLEPPIFRIFKIQALKNLQSLKNILDSRNNTI